MAEYTLYGFAQSGNAYKPALALELAGADWAPRFVDYFDGETRTPAYRAINVMGEVPVLEHRGHAPVAVGRDPRLPRRDARDVRTARRRTSGARSCAGCCSTTTSSRATRRRTASCARSRRIRRPAVLAEFRKRAEDGVGRARRASRRPALRRRRPADDRRPLAVRLPVLAGRDRRRLGRLSEHRRAGSRASPRRRAGVRPTN